MNITDLLGEFKQLLLVVNEVGYNAWSDLSDIVSVVAYRENRLPLPVHRIVVGGCDHRRAATNTI